MGGDGVGIGVICGVLHRAEVVDLILRRDDHQTTWMLARGTAHADTACRQAVFLRLRHHPAPLLQILLGIAIGGLFRHACNGAGAKHMAVAKHLNTVVVRSGLVLAGEVQIDIRHLVAAEAQEGFEGDVEALLGQGRAALGADRIRQIRAAGHTVGHFKGGVLAFGAAVVGRKDVYKRQGLAPAMSIDDTVYKRVNPDNLEHILARYRQPEEEAL